MSDSAALWPLPSDIIAATAPQNRGTLPPVCPPPGHRCRRRPSPARCCPRLLPRLQVLTPVPTSVDHRHPPHHLTYVLPKRRRLS
jgi:hypothetical protein